MTYKIQQRQRILYTTIQLTQIYTLELEFIYRICSSSCIQGGPKKLAPFFSVRLNYMLFPVVNFLKCVVTEVVLFSIQLLLL